MPASSSPAQTTTAARPGLSAARAAAAVGLLFVAVSVYWGLGGRWLLDTVGGDLADQARAGGLELVLVVWGAAGAKAVAAVLPLAALRDLGRPTLTRDLRVLTWVEAAVLTTYGLVLTGVGLVVQAGLIDTSGADHRALAWHAYLWDPWFLGWGVLVTAALLVSRSPARPSAPVRTQAPAPMPALP